MHASPFVGRGSHVCDCKKSHSRGGWHSPTVQSSPCRTYAMHCGPLHQLVCGSQTPPLSYVLLTFTKGAHVPHWSTEPGENSIAQEPLEHCASLPHAAPSARVPVILQ